MIILCTLNIPYEVNSVTDLTKLNCPDNFSITEANTTNGDSSLSSFLFATYVDKTHQDRVENIVIDGDT